MLIGLGAVQSTTDKATLVSFQRSGKGDLPMLPHGHPDPNTLINRGDYDPADSWQEGEATYLATGEKQGTFMRDLSGVNSQIPQWAWLVLGGTFTLLSVLAYRSHKQEKKHGKKK